MLAGVLLSVCLAPVRFAADSPLAAAPIVLTWAILLRVRAPLGDPRRARRRGARGRGRPVGARRGVGLLPAPEWTTPVFEPGVLVGLALPLFIVTMASQNVTGMTVLATYGYRPRLPPVLAGTGAATVAAAPFGGHALNLAAISAALTAGPGRRPRPRAPLDRRGRRRRHLRRARPRRRADRRVRGRRAAAADRGRRRARAARRARGRPGRRGGGRGAPRRGRRDARRERLRRGAARRQRAVLGPRSPGSP